jgi:hypothetical protein
MAGPGDTSESPWPPLTMRSCSGLPLRTLRRAAVRIRVHLPEGDQQEDVVLQVRARGARRGVSKGVEDSRKPRALRAATPEMTLHLGAISRRFELGS